ncbi:hypothetical protein MMC11_005961 [Xylographa trunciseda]|nr:hypothetical protein [Xylographa trunciseda]
MGADNKPPAFETLPVEIRYHIYRYLLRTSHTFVSNAPEQRYEMHPAILRTNKKISAEGKAVMEENDFVAVRLDPEVDLAGSEVALWFGNVPKFQGIAAPSIIRRALTISIALADSTSILPPIARTAVFMGPESLYSLIESIWLYFTPIGEVPRHRIVMRLLLDTKSSGRAKALLRPLLMLHDYRIISITGTVDKKYATDVVDQIARRNPRSDIVKGVVNDHMIQAEKAYVQGLYFLAIQEWGHIMMYCDLLSYGTHFPAAKFKKLVDITRPDSSTVQRAQLGIVKAGLRTERYSKALSQCQYSLEEGIPLDWLMEARFLLCAWIAYILGDEDDCAWIHEAHEAVLLRLDPQYSSPIVAVLQEAVLEVSAIAAVHGTISHQTFEDYLTLLGREDGSTGSSNETFRIDDDELSEWTAVTPFSSKRLCIWIF